MLCAFDRQHDVELADESAIADGAPMLLIVLAIAVAIGLIAHKHLRNFAAACLVTVVLTTGIAWAMVPQHFGWLDRTFYTNLFAIALVALGAATGVGLWLRSRRRAN